MHSLTKFINGASDCVAGAICASKTFVNQLADVNSGASMLLGPVLDSTRSAGVLKNLHTLHLRMKQHSANALYLAKRLQAVGVRVHYPGLSKHPQLQLLNNLMNEFHSKYFISGEINSEVKDPQARMDEIEAMHPDAEISHLDGVSVDYEDWHFNVRPSNTEPLLRLNLESLVSREDMERKRDEVLAVIRG